MSKCWCFASFYAGNLDMIGVIHANTKNEAAEKLCQTSWDSKHSAYADIQRVYEDYKYNFGDQPNFHLPQNGFEFLHMIDKLNHDVDSTTYHFDQCNLI